MNSESRVKNSAKNSMIGVFVQVASILLNFGGRVIFLKVLNELYLGINGLFSNILTLLSLAELGVGTAIAYNLYKPIAENDILAISKLMNFYKKAYTLIGCVITVLGIILIPFLKFIINTDVVIDHLSIYYVMFLLNTSCSYFFAYKKTIFLADQKEYVISKVRLIFSILKVVLQSLVLILTKSFLLYCVIMILCTIFENIYISIIANKQYPFLNSLHTEYLDKNDIKKIFSDIKALMIYKIGSTVLDGTDNVILSAFIGLNWVGLLSNYTLIINSINMVISQIISAVTASVGNFIAKEDKEKYGVLLDNLTFFTYMIYSIVFVGLLCLLNPFIEIVFGPQYLLNVDVVVVLSINFYIFGMLNPIWIFRTTMGLFVYGKYRPIVSAILNVIISILLVKLIGPVGVLVGTTITRLITNVWYDPYVVHRYGLNSKPNNYYVKWLFYMVVSLIIGGFAYSMCLLYVENTVFSFITKGIFCVSLTLGVNAIIFRKHEEFAYFRNILKRILKV